jgi:hypothetical protein
MKQKLLPLLAIIATTSSINCSKVCDQVYNHPGQPLTYCNIKTFNVSFRNTYNEFSVEYNSNGHPKDVIAKNAGGPPQNYSLEQHFRYDKKGRLTDWITNYPGLQQVKQWRTYHYVTSSKVQDSTYAGLGALITDAHPLYNQSSVVGRMLDFDRYGRIIKITTPATNTVQNIVYDANGNSNQYPAYDTAINIMQTNSVWMFVNLNYNVNNYVSNLGQTVTYTYDSSNMLPVNVSIADAFGGTFMSVFTVNSLGIEYDCGGTTKLQ